jgi:hypothetical protein
MEGQGRANEHQILFGLGGGGKQLHKHMKCLTVFMEKKLFLVSMSWNDLKDSVRDVSSLRVMQGVGGLDYLKFSSGCKSS